MKIKALYTFSGILDLGALERLQEQNPVEKIPFRHYIRPGEIIEVNDKFYSLACIQNAISAGYIEVGDVAIDPYQNSTLIDPSFSGTTIKKTAGEDLVIGDIIYYKADGKAYKARADSETTMIAIGVAATNADADEPITILIEGLIRNSSAFSFTTGGQASSSAAIVYISDLVAGEATQDQPSISTHLVQIIGYAVSSDVLSFKPDYTYICLK